MAEQTEILYTKNNIKYWAQETTYSESTIEGAFKYHIDKKHINAKTVTIHMVKALGNLCMKLYDFV